MWSSLVDFMATQSLTHEVSDELEITKKILVARNLLLQNQIKTAFKILDKAEKMAIEVLQFSLLNEIYHTKIQYAHTNSVLLESLLEKFRKNQNDLIQEEKLNMAYAVIKEKLQKLTFEGKAISYQTIIQETFKRFEISNEAGLTYKSLYQLAQIVNMVASAKRDFFHVNSFLIDNYKDVSSLLKESEKHHYYHIKVLYLIANILFRKKDFEESLRYLDLMHQQMEKQQKKYFESSFLTYKCLVALNKNYLGKGTEAISILETEINRKKFEIGVMLDIQLSLVVFYFQQNQFKKALGVFSKFYHSDNWYIEKAGYDWVIQKNIVEILLHVELENSSFVDSKFRSFERKYFPFLKKKEEHQVITFIKIVKILYLNPEKATTKDFVKFVDASFNWKLPKQEDIFVMSFYAWLKSKMNNTPLYETTLNLIRNS